VPGSMRLELQRHVVHAAVPPAGTFKLALGVPENPRQRRLAELVGIVAQAAHRLLNSHSIPMLLRRSIVSVQPVTSL
jgi:hypothetical protein